MRLLNIVAKVADVIIDDISKPKSFETGERFEEYVKEYLFPANYYDLMEMTHNHHTNDERYVESSLKPDFKFRDRLTKREFYVEAKFRTSFYQNKLVWCNEKQLERYQAINKQQPVFLIIGDGGEPDFPDYLSLIPISKAKYTGLFKSFVDQFQIEPERPVTSKALWSR